jgi:hypothetical protein
MSSNKYYCDVCKFSTKYSGNLTSHMITKSHIAKCKKLNKSSQLCISDCKIKIFICTKCNKEYTNRSSLWCHTKKCSEEKDNLDVEYMATATTSSIASSIASIVPITSKSNNLVKILIDQLKSKDEIIKSVVGVADKNADVTKKSMSMLKYANEYIISGEPLQQLESDKAYELLGYDDNDDSDEIDYSENIETYVYKYSHNIFQAYIGDMIIKYYKTNNVTNTNILTTDASRLSMIILQSVDKSINENEKEWINDKSGKRFTLLILTPLLAAIKNTIDKYMENYSNSRICNMQNQEKMLKILHGCCELRRDLNNGLFVTPILKYIAPTFHFDSFDKPIKKNKKTKK